MLALLQGAGALALFGLEGLSHLLRPPFYGRQFLAAFLEFAFYSLPVVALTAIFSGMVIALHSRRPLFDRDRPEVENVRAYLPALQARLERLQGAGAAEVVATSTFLTTRP